jgi:hypothetical protein
MGLKLIKLSYCTITAVTLLYSQNMAAATSGRHKPCAACTGTPATACLPQQPLRLHSQQMAAAAQQLADINPVLPEQALPPQPLLLCNKSCLLHLTTSAAPQSIQQLDYTLPYLITTWTYGQPPAATSTSSYSITQYTLHQHNMHSFSAAPVLLQQQPQQQPAQVAVLTARC